MQNAVGTRNTATRVVAGKEKSTKVSYPVALFAQDEEVNEGLQKAIQSSKQLSLIGELSDIRPRTMKKLRFVYPSVILVHFKDAEVFDQHVILELKRTWPDAGIIVYTPAQHDEMIRQSFQAGADGYILQEKQTHPFDSIVSDYLQKGIPPVSPKVVSRVIGFMKKPLPPATGKQKLTEKQKAIASLLVEGQSYDEIAAKLGMRLDAVRYHIKQIYSKYNIHKSTQLSRMLLG